MENVMKCITGRRSTRVFSNKLIVKETITELLEAARWAPSAKNTQPWRFVVVLDDEVLRDTLASTSIYKRWLRLSKCLIAVFIDTQNGYDYIKDAQAVGAAIQNMLLAGHEMGLGMCWVGEILESEVEVKKLLNVPEPFKLMAVLAIGHSGNVITEGKRRSLDESILGWY